MHVCTHKNTHTFTCTQCSPTQTYAHTQPSLEVSQFHHRTAPLRREWFCKINSFKGCVPASH